jgi:hypothetical protein
MKKITLFICMMLFFTASSMASFTIDLTSHAFSSWGDGCTVSGNTITFTGSWKGAGCWLADNTGSNGGMDASQYDYLWIKFKSCTCDFTLDAQYMGSTDGTIDESYDTKISGKSGDIIVGVKLNTTHSDALAQFFLQSHAEGVIDVEGVYLGSTDEYTAAVNNYKSQRSDLSLAELGSGWGSSTYDAVTKTVTIGDDWSGKGWWLDKVDYSDFDKFVIDFNPATIANGKIVIEYNDGTNNNDEGVFDAGTAEKICNLSAAKNSVKQIYIQGPAGSTYTLSAAYVAVASYTTGIKSLTNANENSAEVSSCYYTVAGQKIGTLQKGINIVRTRLSNGSTVTKKVLINK